MAKNKNFEYGDAQIPGDRSPWRLNFVWWFLVFVNAKYGTCFMSQFWCLEFLGGF